MENKQWSKEHIDFLKENYKNLSIKELAEKLNRTEYAIRWKASYLQLTLPQIGYTKEEDEFILANHKVITIQEIAEQLGRTKASVNKRIHKIIVKEMPTFDKNEIAIESNIPFKNSVAESYRNALAKLEVGDSFVFDKKDYQIIRNQHHLFFPKKFTSRSIDKETSRLWRIC
jgi:biotin operon repressor